MENDWNKKIEKASKDQQAGFLFINKEAGWTSHDVVAKLRRLLKIKKIGHAGTLDPMATGLLIVGIGKATTLLDYWHQFPKTYLAEMEFGKTSDTYDAEGKIICSDRSRPVTTKKFKLILTAFQGRQLQAPPPFSAKKINGQKAYDLARQGKEVKLKPKEIEIFSINIIDIKDNKATIEVTCSTGTYIRSLIHDIGLALETGAIMTKLVRVSIGSINLKQAVVLNQINQKDYYNYLYNINNLILS